MNKTNFLHALYALAIQAGFASGTLPVALYFKVNPVVGLWVGWAGAICWFISREHAHRQNDIADVTQVPVPQQNPMKGFRGWSLDAKLDALFPFVA